MDRDITENAFEVWIERRIALVKSDLKKVIISDKLEIGAGGCSDYFDKRNFLNGELIGLTLSLDTYRRMKGDS